MNLREQGNDDLTKITGIGSARQQLLRELLNISNYQDLAALSPAEVVARLEESGQTISEDLVKEWILEAKAASHLKAAGQNISKEAIKSWTEKEKARESAEAKAKSSSENGDWQTIATFLVFFQERSLENGKKTRRIWVHDHDADLDKGFDTFETDEHGQWMLERVHAKIKQIESSEPSGVEEITITEPSATVQINEIRIYQPPESESPTVVGEPGEPFPGSISGNELFSLEVIFTVSGGEAEHAVKEQANYRARFYAYESSTETGDLLGDTDPKPLEKGVETYTSAQLETTLEPGTYRLWALVTLNTASILPNYIAVPQLQVV